MPRVVNIRDPDAPPFVVSIMRPSPFGNPVRLGTTCSECGATHTREHDGTAALVCWSRVLYRRLSKEPEYREQVAGLAGKALACVCFPAPCHGDAIVQYVEAYSERLAISGDDELAHVSGLAALVNQARTWKRGQMTL